jgi:hypothetical protein
MTALASVLNPNVSQLTSFGGSSSQGFEQYIETVFQGIAQEVAQDISGIIEDIMGGQNSPGGSSNYNSPNSDSGITDGSGANGSNALDSSNITTLLEQLIEDLLSEFMSGSGSSGGTAGVTPSDGSANWSSTPQANYTPSSSTSVGSGQPVGKTANAASLAEQYLGWSEPQLQADGVDESAPYGESCADFVSSMLQKSGLINWHTNSVANLATQLAAQGWRQVSPADAKPGDVWICDGANGESHTEIVASNNNGNITLIGSNNVSSDMQQVSYDSYSASIPGSYILAPP